MDCDATTYNADGTSDLVQHRGEPMVAIMAHARTRIESGSSTRIEVRNLEGKLINHHPRVTRRAEG